jgi:hypothetical protein
LNKQSLTADKGWSSSLAVRQGVNNSTPKKIRLLRNVTRGLRRILWNDLGNGEWMLGKPNGRVLVEWIHIAVDSDQWRALVNTVTNLRVP